MESMTEIFGDVIYSYTREQALEDGFLVDVSETASEAGFTIPVAMTRAAWTDLVEWNDNNRAFQDEAGRLWDVLTMARYFARGVKGSSVNCEVVRVPNTPKATVPRKAGYVLHCGPGDNAEPVITIMVHGED